MAVNRVDRLVVAAGDGRGLNTGPDKDKTQTAWKQAHPQLQLTVRQNWSEVVCDGVAHVLELSSYPLFVFPWTSSEKDHLGP